MAIYQRVILAVVVAITTIFAGIALYKIINLVFDRFANWVMEILNLSSILWSYVVIIVASIIILISLGVGVTALIKKVT